ncbi:TRAM domain-containing protein [Haladaptatus caseinilyticus]|uniref:TRAM domain-containing protein n=1 Tax=Haladaptatus caseinilyticus TaxID=2993314 RepID=UPI00224A9023|nr:TRAM domain-containing protein [Haladaptatus caseinilyticus]
MEIPDTLLCLFSESIEEQQGSYTITVPKQEVTDGDIHENGSYRVALIGSRETRTDSSDGSDEWLEPPVEEGDRRNVEIDDIGNQGDGIASVERGYIVIVPDTDPQEQVTVEITSVTSRFAFAEVVDREIDEE